MIISKYIQDKEYQLMELLLLEKDKAMSQCWLESQGLFKKSQAPNCLVDLFLTKEI